LGSVDPGHWTDRAFVARLEGRWVLGRVGCISKRRVVARLEDVRLDVTGSGSIDDIPAVWTSEELVLGDGQIVRVPVEEARRILARSALIPRWLSESERSTLERFTVSKRREEWLAATLAAKAALRRAGGKRAWTE